MSRQLDAHPNLLAIIVACGYFNLTPTPRALAEALLDVGKGVDPLFQRSKKEFTLLMEDIQNNLNELLFMNLVQQRPDCDGYFAATEDGRAVVNEFDLPMELVNVPAITMIRMRSARFDWAAAA